MPETSGGTCAGPSSLTGSLGAGSSGGTSGLPTGSTTVVRSGCGGCGGWLCCANAEDALPRKSAATTLDTAERGRRFPLMSPPAAKRLLPQISCHRLCKHAVLQCRSERGAGRDRPEVRIAAECRESRAVARQRSERRSVVDQGRKCPRIVADRRERALVGLDRGLHLRAQPALSAKRSRSRGGAELLRAHRRLGKARAISREVRERRCVLSHQAGDKSTIRQRRFVSGQLPEGGIIGCDRRERCRISAKRVHRARIIGKCSKGRPVRRHGRIAATQGRLLERGEIVRVF